MKKALLITLVVILASFVSAIRQSTSRNIYIANAEQASEYFMDIYPVEVGPLEHAEVYRWPVILRPSDILEEAFLPSAPPIRIRKPSWLFFVDLQPGSLYQHPTQFILIRQNGGALEVHARNTFPKLNDVRLFSTHEERQNRVLRLKNMPYLDSIELDALMDHEPPGDPTAGAAAPIDNEGFKGSRVPALDSVDLTPFYKRPDEQTADFERRVLGFLETPQPLEERILNMEGCDTGACPEVGKKLALVIDGGGVDRAPSQLAVQSLAAAGYTTYRLSSANAYVDEASRIYPTDLDSIDAAFEWLSDQITGCCDEVLILLHAHSSPAGEMEMNPLRRRFIYDSVTGRPTGEVRRVGRENGGYLNTRELKSYLDRLQSCKVKVFLQASFAGVHLERGLNILPDSRELGCLCRVVAVSATARQTARESGYYAFVKGLSAVRGFSNAFASMWNWTQGPLKTELQQTMRQQLPQISATVNLYCSDADGDGLCYGEEVAGGYSDPDVADTDGDGFDDGLEAELGTDPQDNESHPGRVAEDSPAAEPNSMGE